MADEQIDEVPVQRTITSVNVVYCGVCGLPPEYCEFGPSYDTCLHWLSDNHPDLFEQIQNSLSSIPKKNQTVENINEEKKESDENKITQNMEEKENDSDNGEEKDGESKSKKDQKNKKKKESKSSISAKRTTKFRFFSSTSTKSCRFIGCSNKA